MRRSILVTLLTTVAAACSGSGAGTTTTTDAPPVTPQVTAANTTPTTAVAEIPPAEGPLIVWVSSEAVADAVIDRGDAYTEATGVEVFVVTIFSAPGDDFLDELLAGEPLPESLDEFGGSEIPDSLRRTPDLFIGPHTWLAELAEAGLAGPVDLPDGLPRGAVEAVSLRGFTIGVPLAVDAIVQFRNPSLMPEAPGDVSDFSCSEEVSCLLLPGDGDPDVHHPFLASLGAYVFGDDPAAGFATDDIGVDSTEAIASAVILQSLIEEGTVGTAADREDARSRFGEGEAAVIWDGAAVLSDFGQAIVEPLPTIGSSPAVSPVRVTAAWANPAGLHPTEAVEFAIDHLASIQGSTAIARALGLAPVWPDGASDREQVVIEAADTGRAVPYIAEAAAAWEVLGEAFTRIHNGVSAGTALVDAADEIRFPG